MSGPDDFNGLGDPPSWLDHALPFGPEPDDEDRPDYSELPDAYRRGWSARCLRCESYNSDGRCVVCGVGIAVPDERPSVQPASGAAARAHGLNGKGRSDTDAERESRAPRVWTPLERIEVWRQEGPVVHEATGLRGLDDLTGGGPVYGTRWYLLGAPDAGKTMLLLQLADGWARRGVVVGILAVDEEADDLTTRIAQRAKFTRLECEERHPDTLRELEDSLIEVPIRMYDDAWTIEAAGEDLAAHAAALSAADSSRRRVALFVDSVQTVECRAVRVAERELGERQVVTANVRAIRRVGTAHRMIVVATSEMNRNSYRNAHSAQESNDMAAGKETGAIEYSARVLLSLRNVPNHGDLVQMRVVKNKHGPSGDDLYLSLDRRHQRLIDGDAPPEPEADNREHAKVAKARERLVAVAVAVVHVLHRQPGIGIVKLRAAVRAELGHCTDGDTDAAVALLGPGVSCAPGARGAHHYTLDVGKLAPDILARVGPIGGTS